MLQTELAFPLISTPNSAFLSREDHGDSLVFQILDFFLFTYMYIYILTEDTDF